MENQTILFENMDSNVEGTAFSKTLMSKVAIKKRIKNTTLQGNIAPFNLIKWQGQDDALTIHWKFMQTLVGEILIATTTKGVCFMGFSGGNQAKALLDLHRRFPENPTTEQGSEMQYQVIDYVNNPELNLQIYLHLKGSAFQLSIWEKLLLVPFGGLTTYLQLSGDPKNARAVGTAVGANPVCFILPCHRVVRSDGSFDGYYWGTELKRKLLIYEAAVSKKITNLESKIIFQ